MFVQVIHATVHDQLEIEAEQRRWQEELMPGAEGFLGTTGGITNDGRFIMVVRFSSADAARSNSRRKEQHDWWERFSSHLAGEATFHESSDITTYLGGGKDDARFVQVMQGRVRDVDAARTLNERMEQEMPAQRPDILGGLTATYDDGHFTDVVYFTSIEEARQNEKVMEENPPLEMQEWMSLLEGDLAFFDLEDPWLVSRTVKEARSDS